MAHTLHTFFHKVYNYRAKKRVNMKYNPYFKGNGPEIHIYIYIYIYIYIAFMLSTYKQQCILQTVCETEIMYSIIMYACVILM